MFSIPERYIVEDTSKDTKIIITENEMINYVDEFLEKYPEVRYYITESCALHNFENRERVTLENYGYDIFKELYSKKIKKGQKGDTER